MFKLAAKRVVWWPVTVRQPREDGSGEVDTFAVKLKLELLTTEELRAHSQGVGDDDAALLARKIQGWDTIGDEDGNAIPYSEEGLRAALNIPYVRGAFVLGLIEASSGRAAGKNSLRGSAGS